jgi:hypothetical protein
MDERPREARTPVRRRRRTVALLAGVTLALGWGLGPAQASPSRTGEQPFCGQVWGSLPETIDAGAADSVVTDVRAGRHVCFDRVVIDLRGPAAHLPSYDVRYLPAVSEQGSGAPVPLRGGAALQVVVRAPAHDGHYRPTYLPGDPAEVVDVTGFETVRQVAWAGSFEGQTTIGIGTRARLPFRTFVLLGEPGTDRAARLVIDVGHLW